VEKSVQFYAGFKKVIIFIQNLIFKTAGIEGDDLINSILHHKYQMD
jgi:hypothetical protein